MASSSQTTPFSRAKQAIKAQPQKSQPATFDKLVNRIVEGLQEYDGHNRSKLEIARKYGPLLIELKELVPHGQYEKLLKQRYPTVSYDTCNRWVWIANHEQQVAEALTEFPDTKWSVSKVMSHIKDGSFDDDIDDDDDEPDDVEESEAFAAEAESEADNPDSENDFDGFTVTVMLTDQSDFEAFSPCLPNATRSNHNQTLNLTGRYDQDKIGHVLRAMATVIETTGVESLKLMVTT